MFAGWGPFVLHGSACLISLPGAGGSQVGCPYSRTPHYGTSSSNVFSATCARCSCQDSSYADGAGYVEASDSSCPDFAAQRKPDNLGHCYCRMAEARPGDVS